MLFIPIYLPVTVTRAYRLFLDPFPSATHLYSPTSSLLILGITSIDLKFSWLIIIDLFGTVPALLSQVIVSAANDPHSNVTSSLPFLTLTFVFLGSTTNSGLSSKVNKVPVYSTTACYLYYACNEY